MSLLPPSVLRHLARRQILAPRAVAAGGVGERRSYAKGGGFEFADHRPYQTGDDLRYIDRHVLARLGEHHVRQFSLYQQLPVTFLLDASASMRFGQPNKFEFARALAAGLSYVALVGGDRLLIGVFSGERLDWFGPLHGAGRAPRLFSWLEKHTPSGTVDFVPVAKQVVRRLPTPTRGLLVIASDWMMPDIEPALHVLGSARQELVGIQVLAPEEEDPTQLGAAELRLVDAEGRGEVDLSLSAELIGRYRENFESWSGSVRDAFVARQGRFFRVRSDNNLESVLTSTWRKEGLIS